MPKRNRIVEIIAGIILAFFAHLVTCSYIQLQSLKNLLVFYTENTTEVAWTMIIVEFLTVTLLFLKKTRQIGFILTILISFFAIYILFSKPTSPHAFGGILNNLTPSKHLIIYSLLILLSIIGFGLHRIKRKDRNIEESKTIAFT